MHRIQEKIELNAPKAAVFQALTEAPLFSELTGGAPAELNGHAGDAFALFGGMILGRNIECESAERLVQAWRAKTWEPGVYSIVSFTLSGEGDQCTLALDHSGFPDGQGQHLAQGWRENYLSPLRKRFGSFD